MGFSKPFEFSKLFKRTQVSLSFSTMMNQITQAVVRRASSMRFSIRKSFLNIQDKIRPRGTGRINKYLSKQLQKELPLDAIMVSRMRGGTTGRFSNVRNIAEEMINNAEFQKPRTHRLSIYGVRI